MLLCIVEKLLLILGMYSFLDLEILEVLLQLDSPDQLDRYNETGITHGRERETLMRNEQ